MLVISLREFRGKQNFYVNKIKHGEDIILKTRDNFIMKLVPITEDDTIMTKEEFYAKIEHSLRQAKEGKTVQYEPRKGLSNILHRK
ncbi:MAG: prevent-host-death protein [Prevotellaceae bacterium]|jgi:antitoxin (DNA-binding transcriptional repressor) of toxin-antitoxin stability system|nr:prevent-host-death protein [Prevotellaceae bacterium]